MATKKKESQPLYLPNESPRGREGDGPWLDDIRREQELAYRELRMGLEEGTLDSTDVPGLVTADKLVDNNYGAREAHFRDGQRPGQDEAAAETIEKNAGSAKYANPVK